MSPPGTPAAGDSEVSEHRRLVLLIGLALVVALAAVADSAFPHHPPHVAVAPSSPTVAVHRAASTAWYCPGPLPIGPRAEAASIAVANLGGVRLDGQLKLAPTSGRSFAEAVSVAPDGERVLALPESGRPAWGAVTVLLDGAGAAVEQVVRGPWGTAASPCVEAASPTTYFPAGSTLGADDLSLALYDPTATPAVADVSAATGSSTVTPAALQGISVAPGQVVVVDVGRSVPEEATVATTVTTTSGEVVAGTLVTLARPEGGLTEAITAGSAGTGDRWWFAPAPLGPRASESFSVLDPGTAPAHVTLRLGAGATARRLDAVVPAGEVVRIEPPQPASNQLSWASVESVSGPQVVVARETVVRTASPPHAAKSSTAKSSTANASGSHTSGAHASASGKTAAARSGVAGSSAAPSPPKAIPAVSSTTSPGSTVAGVPPLADGASITLGTPGGSAEWILPGGEVDSAVGEVLVLANPGRRPAVVLIERLVPGSGETQALSGRLVLAAGGELAWTPQLVAGANAGGLALLVRASHAVVAASFLFGRNPSAGLASPAGIPVSG